jgi:antitoxin VapB
VATAKVFKHGNSQAVRLPKEFRVKVKELDITKNGDVVTLRSKKISYEALMAAVAKSKGGIERERMKPQERDFGPGW